MKKYKIITLIIFSIILLSTITPQVIAQSENDIEPPEDPERLFDKIMVRLFKFLSSGFGFPLYVLRFTEEESFTATPEAIVIDLLDETNVEIGVINESSGGYKRLDEDEPGLLFPASDFEFKLELPDYLPKDSFVGYFNPPRLDLYTEGYLKTNLTLVSYLPEGIDIPENIIITVNITRYTNANNLYFPPPGLKYRLPIYALLKTGRMPILWFLSSIGLLGGVPFGKLYGGKRIAEYNSYIDIVVRLNRSHIVDIVPIGRKEIGPDQLVNIPITVENLGTHLDTFNFRVKMEDDSDILVSPPPALTLGPNEVKQTYITVATPEFMLDPGTLHNVEIEAYSIYEPNKNSKNNVGFFTKGYSMSEVGSMYLTTLIIIIIIIIFFYIYIRKKFMDKYIKIKKPEKKWEKTEEKKRLEALKKEDPKKYQEELVEMKEQYSKDIEKYKNERKISFEAYIKAKKEKRVKEKLQKKEKDKKIITEKEKKVKEEEKVEKTEKIESKVKKEEEVSKKTIEKPRQIEKMDKTSEELKKQKALEKIRREQSKQRKKLKR